MQDVVFSAWAACLTEHLLDAVAKEFECNSMHHCIGFGAALD
jgi:hypothetical protein